MNKWEIIFVKKFKSNNRDVGYNILPGGGSPMLLKEVSQKVGEKLKVSNLGNKNPNFGNKWTDEQKEAQRNKIKGKKHTKESIELIRINTKIALTNPEAKAKSRLKLTGNKNALKKK